MVAACELRQSHQSTRPESKFKMATTDRKWIYTNVYKYQFAYLLAAKSNVFYFAWFQNSNGYTPTFSKSNNMWTLIVGLPCRPPPVFCQWHFSPCGFFVSAFAYLLSNSFPYQLVPTCRGYCATSWICYNKIRSAYKRSIRSQLTDEMETYLQRLAMWSQLFVFKDFKQTAVIITSGVYPPWEHEAKLTPTQLSPSHSLPFPPLSSLAIPYLLFHLVPLFCFPLPKAFPYPTPSSIFITSPPAASAGVLDPFGICSES